MRTNHSHIVNRALTRLKLQQLRLLVAVDKHGNIQNAARELGVSQPAATKMIQEKNQNELKTWPMAVHAGIAGRIPGRSLRVPGRSLGRPRPPMALQHQSSS